MNKPNRPATTVILAMSADGKIADSRRSPARFGSAADKAHLEAQIALADAVLFGSDTLRAYGTTLTISNKKLIQARFARSQSPQPLNLVCSASGKIDPKLRFFSQPVSRWLLTTATGAKLWQNQTGFERILIFAAEKQGKIHPAQGFNWIEALTKLKRLGIEKLAILGGGELVASLLSVDLVDEFWLTVCPVILGGRNAPTPVEGSGFTQQQKRKLELLEIKQIEQEVFLHYRLQHQ